MLQDLMVSLQSSPYLPPGTRVDHSCLNLIRLGFPRETEPVGYIYIKDIRYKALAHVTVEAEKFLDLPVSKPETQER